MDDEPKGNEPDDAKDIDRAQYAMGVKSRMDREPFDADRSPAWQLGWERARLSSVPDDD
jgi:hypothetical protein